MADRTGRERSASTDQAMPARPLPLDELMLTVRDPRSGTQLTAIDGAAGAPQDRPPPGSIALFAQGAGGGPNRALVILALEPAQARELRDWLDRVLARAAN